MADGPNDLRVAGAMLDLLALVPESDRDMAVECLVTVFVDGTSIRSARRDEVMEWVANRVHARDVGEMQEADDA